MSKQEDDTPKLESQLGFPLYVVSRKVISFYQPYLKKLNLTYTQYIVLMALWENNRIPVCELGKVLFLDNGTLSPLLKKMENGNYITRHRSRKDERVVIISLTEKAYAMKEECKSLPARVAEEIGIDADTFQQLHDLLYGVIAALPD